MTRGSRSSSLATRLALVLAVTFGSVAIGSVAVHDSAFAHDEIASSVPEHRAQLDEPISSASIEFGVPVDAVEMALVGPDDRDLPGTVTQTSDTGARLDFETLSQEGQYIVRYLAEEDGHLLAGAISFTYGSSEGSGASNTVWIAFGIVAIAILGLGAMFSRRRSRQPVDLATE